MARKQTALETVDAPSEFDAVFDFAVGNPYPLATYEVTYDEDLVCGPCGYVMMPNWSVAAASQVLKARNPVVAICPKCRAFSRIPVDIQTDE